MMDAPLLTAKLYIPPVWRETVPRPDLIECLSAGLGRSGGFARKLTLVSAPACYGKTTLLAQWVAQCGQPGAWLSLDEGDNDPARFWAYVVSALRTVRAEIGDIAGFIQAFTGTHRYILDYLVEEVLEQQPPGVRQLLLQTSVLDRVCSALCDAVVGTDEPAEGPSAGDSQSVLEHLERHHLFVVPLDDRRQWYRYHHLFVDLLRQRLQREQRDRVPELHRRASEWYERNGSIHEAVNHALAAGDYERMANLVWQNAWAILARGEMITLLRWLDGLPDEMVRSRSQLATFRAWVLALTGQLDDVDACLSGIEDQSWHGEATAVRAYVAHHRGDPTRAIEFGVAVAAGTLYPCSSSEINGWPQ